MKKVLSLLLSLAMLLSIVSVVDFSAYADTLTTGKCGDNVKYSFESDTGTLTISGTGDMYDYSSNKSVFYDNGKIKTVIIEKGVTSIGSGAFENCTRLSSITIPDSVTSIGNYVFEYCESLTSVTIPDSVTSIGDCAFGFCSSLASVTISDSVTSIGNSAFKFCLSLASVTIPDSVTSIGSDAFYDCARLISINVEENNINYFSVNGVLFNRNQNELMCYPAGKKDKNYEIPKGVTSIGDASFFACKSLTNITIPNGVTSIGCDAFEYCDSLASVTIPNSVTSIDSGAFQYCEALSSVTIPDSVTSIGGYAFYACTSLTSVTIPDGVTDIGYSAFSYCTSLISINVEENNIKYFSVNGVLFNRNQNELMYYPAGKNDKNYEIPGSVTSIGNSAFGECRSLTNITIPDSVTSISENAFYGCASLTSVTIPNSVTSIGSYAFRYCTSLVSVTIPDSVTSIGDYAFKSCTNLKSIIVLTPDCKFGSYIVEENVKIYGFANSTTSKYANNEYHNSYGNIFIKIYCNDYGMEHIYSKKVIKNSTCKNSGEISYTCDRCYQSYNETTPALGGEHDYKDEVITQPTCTTNGITRYTCSRCGDKYDAEVSALGHDYVSKVLTQPTCTEKGTTRYTCSRCGDSYDEENIDALGHNYETKIVTQPTCTKKGTTRYICSRCGDSYEKENIESLGHNYVSKVIKQPTCTEKGVTRYTCSRCGDSYDKDDVAALGHNYVSKVLTQPTCTEKGVTRYTCTRCNNYYDKEDIEELGHDTKIVERVEPTLTEDGFYRVECQRDGCGYSSSHPLEQLTLGYNQKVKSNGSDTYKIEMDKSGYLIFDFEGESKKWDINIYDEDYNKIDTLKPVYKEFYKKSYLQISLGSNVPNQNQIAALFAGKYYVEIDRLNDDTNDNFSGNYTFSIDYSPANETIKETKNDFYYDAPTAKNIELNKTYNGFLGAKYACYNYVGNPILTTDERDAYKIEIPKGSGLSQFSVTLSSKAFAPLGSNCTLILYNSEFEPYDGFKPLTVSLNSTLNETIYLYEGTYYIAVVNDNSPIEYTFTTTFKPQGTFTCVEHKGKLVNTVNPTCTQNGYNSYVCQICGTQYKEIIPAYGHNVVIDYEVAPTVVSSGLTRGSHCSICGAVITPQTVIPQISAPATTPTQPTQTSKPVAKPKSAKIKKVKSAKKAVSVEWKKVSGVKGYQIQVATDKKFKKNKKTVTVKKQKTTKVTIKKLKAKKKYYVRIRTYKTVNGKKVYSSWSKVKTVKTK